MSDGDRLIVLARVAERAERYDDMADFMKQRVELGTPLSSEERDMFSAAFKNALTERRMAVRVSVGIAAQEKEEGRDGNFDLAVGYKSKVGTELYSICAKALSALEQYLVPTAASVEDKTYYLKMQGDYYRYSAEFADGEARQTSAAKAKQAYLEGLQTAQGLHACHSVRLGLALNYSVFLHEVIQDNAGALDTANIALRTAAEEIKQVEPESQAEAIATMQLLQDNLDLWSAA